MRGVWKHTFAKLFLFLQNIPLFFFLLKLTEKAQIQRCNLVISVNRSEVVIISINMTKHETTEAGGKTCNFHRHLTELSCKS